MKQIPQSLKTNISQISEISISTISVGLLLLKNLKTLVYLAAEEILVDLLMPTIELLLNKLDKPLKLSLKK